MENKLEHAKASHYMRNNIGATMAGSSDITDSLMREQEEEEKLQFKPELDYTQDIRENYNYLIKDQSSLRIPEISVIEVCTCKDKFKDLGAQALIQKLEGDATADMTY